MKVGFIGLGRMGSALAIRALQAGHEVYGFDVSTNIQQEAQKKGIALCSTLEELAQQVHIFWLMVPVGKAVEDTIAELLPHLGAGDIIIDGGNSNYKDSIVRARLCASHGIIFLDCGTSGGLYGKEIGFCLMVGGDREAFTKVHSLFKALAAPGGMAYVGPSGTGHFVKMVHNGIEYALLQAYAEGFHILRDAQFDHVSLDLEEISRIWSTSSVIRSWILDLAHDVFVQDQQLDTISGEIEETGMGQWTVQAAEKMKVPVPIIKEALAIRAWSRQTGGNFATKIVAMLRNKFGGHAIKKVKGSSHENN